MTGNTIWVTYMLVYIATIIFFVVLGCYMFAQRDNSLSSHGEIIAKRRITRTMGVAMFVWAFEMFIYLPPMLAGCPSTELQPYGILILVSLMLNTPMVYLVMFAVVQRKINTTRWAVALSAPFFLLAVWHVLQLPYGESAPFCIGAVLSVASLLLLLIKFASEYHIYIRRVQSAYSDITGRKIIWAWVCFAGLAGQGIIFVAYVMFWSPLVEVLYMLLSIVNGASLCFCTRKQMTLDLDVVPEAEPEVPVEDKPRDKNLYDSIEQKLAHNCEGNLLFLEPNITLESLAQRLTVNRTYLGMYLHQRNLTFYQYINTLRARYAYKLMQENPRMPIRKVSEQSGFRSQTTFRKVFLEINGCLPSELDRGKG